MYVRVSHFLRLWWVWKRNSISKSLVQQVWKSRMIADHYTAGIRRCNPTGWSQMSIQAIMNIFDSVKTWPLSGVSIGCHGLLWMSQMFRWGLLWNWIVFDALYPCQPFTLHYMRLADVGHVETRELRHQHGTLQDDRYLHLEMPNIGTETFVLVWTTLVYPACRNRHLPCERQCKSWNVQ